MVKRVLIRKTASFWNLVLLGVKDVRGAGWVSVFLASKYQDLTLGYCAGSEPVFYILFEGAAPDLYKLPEGLLFWSLGVQSLNVCDWWLVPSENVNVSLLNSHGSGQVPVPIQFRFLPPESAFYRIHLAGFGSVVKPWPNCVNELIPNSREAVAFSWVYHVVKLNQSAISKLIGVVARLRSVLCPSSDENSPVVGLNWAESNWNVEVDVQNLPLLSLLVDVVKGDYLLVKFKKVDLICLDHFYLLDVLSVLGFVQHLDPGLFKIIGHCELRVSVETYVLGILPIVPLLLVGLVGGLIPYAIVLTSWPSHINFSITVFINLLHRIICGPSSTAQLISGEGVVLESLGSFQTAWAGDLPNSGSFSQILGVALLWDHDLLIEEFVQVHIAVIHNKIFS